ncbi:hypothetical protein ACNKHP_09645 [Shigella boydii]
MLDEFCGGFHTNTRSVITTHIVDDSFVETVAANAHRRGVQTTPFGDNSNFSGAATDISTTINRSLRETGRPAPSGGHRFFDQEDFTGTSALRRSRIARRWTWGRANRHTNQNARAWTHKAVAVHLFDEVLEHFFESRRSRR